MSYSDTTNGYRIPPHTAFIVLTGTLAAPEKIAYLFKDFDTEDGELAAPFTSLQDYLDAGFIHIATRHIDLTNDSDTLVYVNPAINTSTLNIFA